MMYSAVQAIEFLSRVEALHVHAVHFAIALHDMNLLYLTGSTQSKLCKLVHHNTTYTYLTLHYVCKANT